MFFFPKLQHKIILTHSFIFKVLRDYISNNKELQRIKLYSIVNLKIFNVKNIKNFYEQIILRVSKQR